MCHLFRFTERAPFYIFIHTNLLQLEELTDTPHSYTDSQGSREPEGLPSTYRSAHLRKFRFVGCAISANIVPCFIPDVNNAEFYYLSYTFIYRMLAGELTVQCLSSNLNLQPIYTSNRIASYLMQVGKTVRALRLSRFVFLHYRRRFLRLATQLDFAC